MDNQQIRTAVLTLCKTHSIDSNGKVHENESADTISAGIAYGECYSLGIVDKAGVIPAQVFKVVKDFAARATK